MQSLLPSLKLAGVKLSSALLTCTRVLAAGPTMSFSSNAASRKPSFRLVRVSLDEIRDMPMMDEFREGVMAPSQEPQGASTGYSLSGWLIMGGSVVVIGGIVYLLVKYLVDDQPITATMKQVLVRGQAYAAASLAIIAAPTVGAKFGLYRASGLVSAFYGGPWPLYVLPWVASVSLWIAGAAIPNNEQWRSIKRTAWLSAAGLTGLLMAPMAILPWTMLSTAGLMTLGVVVPVQAGALMSNSMVGFWLTSPLMVTASAATLAIVNPAVRVFAPFVAVAMFTSWLIVIEDASHILQSVRENPDEADDLQIGIRITAVSVYAFLKIMVYMIKIMAALAAEDKRRKRDDEI